MSELKQNIGEKYDFSIMSSIILTSGKSNVYNGVYNKYNRNRNYNRIL